ncbi:MAG: DUF131 domain-containing protein [Candidatus Nanohaloarchaea archaeon]|nr:DUF131 domain-containing protein [Candidatus Nanohaloarchaea archaeon]
MAADTLVAAGLGVILLGVVLVLAGTVLGGDGDGEVEAGGVVFIGPIPVVFGSNAQVAALSVVVGAVMLAALWLWTKGL